MITRLEKARVLHVQTFACELTPADNEDAHRFGFPNAQEGYRYLVRHSLEAFALVTEAGRVLALCGVLRGSSQFWVHTAEVFKRAGLGALRQVRLLVKQLLQRHGVLLIDVDSQNQALVRMADWLGFKTRGVVEKFGRSYHRAYLREA